MISFICVLKACGNIGALYEGKQMHNMIHCNSGLFCILPLATLILMPMEDIFYGKEKWKVTSMHVIVTLRNTKFMCRICFRYFEVFTCVLHFRTAILKHLPYLLTKYFNISQKIKCF